MVDVVGALVALVLVSPLLAAAAIAVCVSSPGPMIHRDPRIGRNGKIFPMLKFRTMFCESDRILEGYLRRHPTHLHYWEQFQKLPEDPRITLVGGLMRRFSIDELPQLFNVLSGEMSLVGPRPISPKQKHAYGPAIAEYVQNPPGITGLWQVCGRSTVSFADRVQYDQTYVRHRSLWLDLAILWRTVWVTVQARGAF